MGELDPASLGQNTSPYIHALTEISKNAFSQTSEYADDPPLEMLFSRDYLAEQAAAVDFSGAAPYEPPTTFDSATSCSPTGYVPTTDASASASAQAGVGHTTHFVVADREGNVVSSTQTLGNVFGSKLMPEGTGLWLNDQLAWSRFEPQGTVFDVYAGRQTLYALCPTLVMRNGRPEIALGTPGGRTIPQTTTQMITNMETFGMDVQEAVSAPRFSFVIPDLLGVEPGIPTDVRAELEALGHNVYVDEFGFGNAHGLTIEYGGQGNPNRFTAARAPRRGSRSGQPSAFGHQLIGSFDGTFGRPRAFLPEGEQGKVEGK
jgi:gamma-glutamyltranspeptidase/glutathione hydrolase